MVDFFVLALLVVAPLQPHAPVAWAIAEELAALPVRL
jgi:hypothetical protein